MKGIAIHAASTESARGMLAALAHFQELVEAEDGSCQVVISLDGDDCEIVAVLGALEEYVTERATGPMRLELDGRRYVMQSDGEAETSLEIAATEAKACRRCGLTASIKNLRRAGRRICLARHELHGKALGYCV
jgi:hypothetical protein